MNTKLRGNLWKDINFIWKFHTSDTHWIDRKHWTSPFSVRHNLLSIFRQFCDWISAIMSSTRRAEDRKIIKKFQLLLLVSWRSFKGELCRGRENVQNITFSGLNSSEWWKLWKIGKLIWRLFCPHRTKPFLGKSRQREFWSCQKFWVKIQQCHGLKLNLSLWKIVLKLSWKNWKMFCREFIIFSIEHIEVNFENGKTFLGCCLASAIYER